MKKNNFNNILCSRNCKDFILLYDGLGNYFLYYQNDMLLEIPEANTPKTLHKNNKSILLETLTNIKEKAKNKIVQTLINEITKIIGDNPKKEYIIKDALMNLIFSLKDAELDNITNEKHFKDAPSVIRQKAMEISKNRGYDALIFDNEIECPSFVPDINPYDSNSLYILLNPDFL